VIALEDDPDQEQKGCAPSLMYERMLPKPTLLPAGALGGWKGRHEFARHPVPLCSMSSIGFGG
jgi:hypothetical protein